jgi:hypothetical protein
MLLHCPNRSICALSYLVVSVSALWWWWTLCLCKRRVLVTFRDSSTNLLISPVLLRRRGPVSVRRLRRRRSLRRVSAVLRWPSSLLAPNHRGNLAVVYALGRRVATVTAVRRRLTVSSLLPAVISLAWIVGHCVVAEKEGWLDSCMRSDVHGKVAGYRSLGFALSIKGDATKS